MKRLFFLLAFMCMSMMGFCQFTFQVDLDGDCVYPETTKAASYGIHVTVLSGTTVMADETFTQGTTDDTFDVSLDEFCVNDNSPIYIIKIEAVKAFINPFEEICKGSGNFGPYSCEDFVIGLNPLHIELQEEIE